MRFIKKHKKLITALTAMLLIAISLGTYVSQTWAAYDTWNSLAYLEFRTGLGEGQHSMKDVMPYGGNYTNDVGEIYSDRSHFFDDIRLDTMSRVTYGRKIRVDSGQRFAIVAANEDTADTGGSSENAGLQFYWSVCEYDENGNIVYDGGWRGSDSTWTVGNTENGDTGYGLSGYPNGEDKNSRQNKVRYVVPIFRWNNGDETVGSGSNSKITRVQIANQFYVFNMITDPFTYTFNLNGGQVNGSGNAITMQRLGIESVSVPQTPTRDGYVFTGWKITSAGGKQAGKVYDAGQLAEMFSDGKYWSSLFANATFEAQWTHADQFVSYMGNGADNMSDFYRSYNAAYDGNTAENFLFKRTGYTSVSGSTWEIKDQFLNLTGGCDGGDALPSSGTLTSIRTKCGDRYQCVDISAASYADGANAQIWDCVNGNAQMYAFVFAGFEDGLPYWVIRNNATGKVLDAAIGTGIDGGNNGANIQQWAYHGGDNQKWTLQMAGDGYFYIRSKLDTNLVLDLLYGSTDNGTNIQLCNYYGGENQQWYLWDNTINLSVDWANNNYKVAYNADGGTLLDENGNATTDTVRTYEYDRTYDFLKAQRAYTVSYETNGGTAAINSSNTDAPGTFNGWNEQLDSNTTHGEVQGSYDWTTGTLNWAAYYNGNPDILNAAGNVYDTIRAIMHYRAFGISENRQFTGASYWLPSVRFRNLTADGGTVNVKADYTNGTVILPTAQKASVEIDGQTISYEFEGWYLDSALTDRVGGAGDNYTPAGNTTLYAKYTTQSENLIFNQKIRVRYENADGTWTSYTTIFDKDFRIGDTVDYDFSSLDTAKWVKPDRIIYTVTGKYLTDGYTTSVDIYRQTYSVTVTYDNDKAFSAKSGEGTYRWGETVTVSVTPAQKNAQYTYRFAGFETDSRLTFRNGTTAASNPAAFVMPERNVTLKARSDSQTNEYAVTVEHYYMDTSGNYPEKPSVTQDLKPYYGETLVHDGLAREIKGLSLNAEKSAEENGNRTQTLVTGNTVIKLYYDRLVCTVTYDYRTNGGTSADQETVKTYYGADADLSVAAYKNGWTHDGWNTKSSSQTGLAQYTVTGNVTLYAVYRKGITVTFVDFAQTYKREASMYNNDTYALIDAPECSTYGGWENVSDVTAVGFNSRADITAEGAEKMEVKSGEEHLKILDSITYYTVCSAAVTLSYELNGGTENDTTKPVKEEVYCNAAEPQEVKGFALQLGESIKESFDLDGYTHSYTFATWAENSPESETRFPCNADYVLKENTVMYALWDESVAPITYYIEFDGNAGTAARNVPDKMEAQYGEEITLPKQQPERTGFTFTGWNTRTDGQGTTYLPEDTVKNLTTVNHATVKLYAQWKQRRIILVKAASTVYNDTIIRRIPGDEEWYNSVGHLTIDELKNYPDELCEQVWHIDKQGNITQVK